MGCDEEYRCESEIGALVVAALCREFEKEDYEACTIIIIIMHRRKDDDCGVCTFAIRVAICLHADAVFSLPVLIGYILNLVKRIQYYKRNFSRISATAAIDDRTRHFTMYLLLFKKKKKNQKQGTVGCILYIRLVICWTERLETSLQT